MNIEVVETSNEEHRIRMPDDQRINDLSPPTSHALNAIIMVDEFMVSGEEHDDEGKL